MSLWKNIFGRESNNSTTPMSTSEKKRGFHPPSDESMGWKSVEDMTDNEALAELMKISKKKGIKDDTKKMLDGGVGCRQLLRLERTAERNKTKYDHLRTDSVPVKNFTDKNGTVIEDGDILQGNNTVNNDYIYEVIVFNSKLCYASKTLECSIDYDGNEKWVVVDESKPRELWVSEYNENKEMIDDIRIIGNKTDNPELLTCEYLNMLKRKWPDFLVRHSARWEQYVKPDDYDFSQKTMKNCQRHFMDTDVVLHDNCTVYINSEDSRTTLKFDNKYRSLAYIETFIAYIEEHDVPATSYELNQVMDVLKEPARYLTAAQIQLTDGREIKILLSEGSVDMEVKSREQAILIANKLKSYVKVNKVDATTEGINFLLSILQN